MSCWTNLDLQGSKMEKECVFPKYVWMKSTALALLSVKGDKAEYYRDAGHWSVKVRMQDGKIVACGNKGHLEHANRKDLVECTKDEWLADNSGYVNDFKNGDD